MSNGRLTICLLTYQRTEYAVDTLDSVLFHLKADRPVSVHIADDGSDEAHRMRLVSIAREHDKLVTVSNSERGGYGRNFNLAMQAIHNEANYVLPLEDDWALTRPFDVEPLIRALDASIGIQCIRLGYLSFTQALFGRVMSAPPEWYKYLLLDPGSPEPHVFAGHPRIETVAYEKSVGPWEEGLAPGPTEFEIAHRSAARQGVAWPMDFIHPTIDPLFAHIGTVRSIDVAASTDTLETLRA